MNLSNKLQLKSEHKCKVFNKPRVLDLPGISSSRLSLAKLDGVVCFVKSVSDLNKWCDSNLSELPENCILWFAYPKKSSPLYSKYNCDINRDKGWECLSKHKFRPVRSIAIDDDWTALRFRHQAQVKSTSKRFQA